MGVEVHVGYVQTGVNLGLFEGSGVKLHRISRRGNHDPSILFRVLSLIGEVRPHLIQTWLPQMDVFGGAAAILKGLPFVLSERSSAQAYPATWKHWLRLCVGRHAAAVVANSEGGAAYWAAQLRVPRVEVIRNGLQFDLIRAALPADPASVDFPSDARLILFAGRLSPEKNLSTLVQAVDTVLVELSDCCALFLGEGALEREVGSRIAASRSGGRMRLRPFTLDLWRWMRRAALFVSISRFEGSPNAVLEAMAVGCPLVVSDVPQHREILDDATARFCEPDSVAGAAAALREVLDAPAAAGARAEEARKRSTEWSVEKAARQYRDLYQVLTSTSGVVA